MSANKKTTRLKYLPTSNDKRVKRVYETTNDVEIDVDSLTLEQKKEIEESVKLAATEGMAKNCAEKVSFFLNNVEDQSKIVESATEPATDKLDIIRSKNRTMSKAIAKFTKEEREIYEAFQSFHFKNPRTVVEVCRRFEEGYTTHDMHVFKAIDNSISQTQLQQLLNLWQRHVKAKTFFTFDRSTEKRSKFFEEIIYNKMQETIAFSDIAFKSGDIKNHILSNREIREWIKLQLALSTEYSIATTTVAVQTSGINHIMTQISSILPTKSEDKDKQDDDTLEAEYHCENE